jgi:hypothetical protein
MSKCYLIWCPIAQESSLGRNGRILGDNRVSKDLPSNNVRLDPDNVQLIVRVSRDFQPDNV